MPANTQDDTLRDLAISECEAIMAERDILRENNVLLCTKIQARELESRYRQQMRRARAKRNSTIAVVYGLVCAGIAVAGWLR